MPVIKSAKSSIRIPVSAGCADIHSIQNARFMDFLLTCAHDTAEEEEEESDAEVGHLSEKNRSNQ